MAPPDVARLQHQRYPSVTRPQSPWMHNENNTSDVQDEDSWEVRAFAEDTASGMGTIWPPKSYTCTFCRREFRSAQALGGHMNVHRRDRARLHQTQHSLIKIRNPNPSRTQLNASSSTFGNSTLMIPNQEFIANGELSLFFQIHNHIPNPLDPNTLLSTFAYPVANNDNNPSFIEPYPHATCPSSLTGSTLTVNPSTMREVDLELRLGHGPTSTI